MQNILTKETNYRICKLGVVAFFLKHKRIILPSLFLLSYVLFYFIIDHSSQSLIAHDEGLYARRSKLVEESANWFSTPFLSPHHKTIGSYWFIALSIKLFGKSELALRLPSILSSFICLLISYFIALKITNKSSALISVFSLSTMPLWIQYSRYASPDMLFVMCILLVILFFLNFLVTINSYKKYFYIFFSGLFISFAFFIRSYMVFVPLLGLTPFIGYHLKRSKKFYLSIFFTGILIGSLPTFLSLFFAYKEFGIEAFTSLFDFAKKQAIGEFDITNLLLIPLNYLYLTFPIGLLLIILLIFTRSKNKPNFPLLTIYYPLISFSILLFMSTSYPHYYLFLAPPFSILFSTAIQSYSFRYSISKKMIMYILSTMIIFITSIILSFILYYNDFLLSYSLAQKCFIYLISFFLSLSFIYSLRYLSYKKYNRNNLIYFLKVIIIPQYISLSLLYNFGIIGNPNFTIKSFLNDKYIASILKNNTIYLYNVDSKIQTLLSYYLPSFQLVESPDGIKEINYLITSDKKLITEYKNKNIFKSIKNFDNHSFLINMSK